MDIAVLDLLTLAVLEETQGNWETEEENRTFLPTDALTEAIRHNHVDYAIC